jgi:hypothetical protein
MGTEITETEVVASPLKRITVGSQRLRVPRSPTIRFMFMHRGFLKKFADETITDDDIEDYYDEVLAFLRRYNDPVDEAKLQDECQLSDLLGFYARWFGGQDEDEDAGDERPPQRRGTTGAKKTATRSRS